MTEFDGLQSTSWSFRLLRDTLSHNALKERKGDMTLLMFFTDWVLITVTVNLLLKHQHYTLDYCETYQGKSKFMNKYESCIHMQYYLRNAWIIAGAVSRNDDREIRHGYFPPTHNDSLVKDFAFVLISPWQGYVTHGVRVCVCSLLPASARCRLFHNHHPVL